MVLTLRERLVLAALTGAAVDVRRRAWPTMALDEAASIARCAVAVADAALEALASADPPAIQRSTMHGGGITLAPTEGMVPGPWEPTPERIAAAQAAGVRRGDGGASRMHAAAAAAEEGEEYGTGGQYGDGSYGDCPANTEAPAID